MICGAAAHLPSRLRRSHRDPGGRCAAGARFRGARQRADGRHQRAGAPGDDPPAGARHRHQRHGRWPGGRSGRGRAARSPSRRSRTCTGARPAHSSSAACCSVRWPPGVSGGAELAALQQFGAEIGLAFQIQDDILDVEGDPAAARQVHRRGCGAREAHLPEHRRARRLRARAPASCAMRRSRRSRRSAERGAALAQLANFVVSRAS